jgi:hypothetical protein
MVEESYAMPQPFQTAVVDRIEGESAVLLVGEREREVHVPVSHLPSGARQSDLLRVRVRGEQITVLGVDVQATRLSKRAIGTALVHLREKNRPSPRQ